MKASLIKYRGYIFLSLLSVNNLFSQSLDSLNQSNDVRFSMTFERGKLDYFNNIQLNTEVFDFLQIESSIGLNVNKTYFQNTFSPQFSFGFGYDLFKKNDNFLLMPVIKGRVTSFNISDDLRFNYLEGLLGYSLVWGEKWFLVQGSYFGRGIESMNEGFDNHVKYWSYAIHFGLGYNF